MGVLNEFDTSISFFHDYTNLKGEREVNIFQIFDFQAQPVLITEISLQILPNFL